MPKLNPRRGAFQATKVTPPAGAAVGAGLQQLGGVLSDIQEQKSKERILDIKIDKEIRERQEKEKDRQDAILAAESLITHETEGRDIIRGIKDFETEQDLNDNEDSIFDSLNQLNDDRVNLFDTDRGRESYQLRSAKERTALISNASTAIANKRIEFRRDAIAAAGQNLLNSIDETTTTEDILRNLELADTLGDAAKDAGLKGDIGKAVKQDAVDEYMGTALSGNPVAQNQFLDMLEASEETKNIFNAKEISSRKDTLISEIDKIDKREAALDTWRVQSNIANMSQLVAGSDTADELEDNIKIAGLTEQEAFVVRGKWAARKPVASSFAKAKNAEQKAKLADRNASVQQSLSDKAARMRLVYRDLQKDKANPGAYIPLEKAVDDLAAELFDNRDVLSEAQFEKYSNLLLYLQSDIGSNQEPQPGKIGRIPLVGKWFRGNDKKKNVYSMVSEAVIELGDSPQETELANRMFRAAKEINADGSLSGRGEGSSFVFDNEQEAVDAFNMIVVDSQRLMLQAQGLSREQADEIINTTTTPQAPPQVTTDEAAMSNAFRGFIENGENVDDMVDRMAGLMAEDEVRRRFDNAQQQAATLTELDIEIERLRTVETEPTTPPAEVRPQVEERETPPATLIEREEGKRLDAFIDTEGNLTVGIGHKVSPEDNLEEGDTITEEQAQVLFEEDLEEAQTGTERVISNLKQLPGDVQEVLVSMAFQMGERALAGFTKMIAALKANDFTKAADEILDSRFAKQTANRARRAASIVREAGQ